MRKILSVLLFLCVLFGAASLSAQGSIKDDFLDLKFDFNYNNINKKLIKFERTLQKENLSSTSLKDDVVYVSTIRTYLINGKENLDKELVFIEKRIDALGEKPKNGGKEIALIAQKRKEFNRDLVNARGRIAEVDILLTKLDEIDSLISNVRNKELLGNLLVQRVPLIYPAKMYDSTKLFIEFFYDIVKSPFDWYRKLNDKQHDVVKSKLPLVLLIIFFITWFGIYLRSFIMRKFGYRKDVENPRYGKKVIAAFSVAVAYGVIPIMIIGSFLAWAANAKLLTTGLLGIALNSLLYYSLYIILARAISRVILTPYNDRWRLININAEKAKHIIFALYFSITIIGAVSFFVNVAKVGNYSIELITYLTSMASAAKALCIILIVKSMMWDGIDDSDDDDESEDGDSVVGRAFRVTFLVSLFALIVFALSLFGYALLSDFILNHVIISFLLIGFILVIRKTFYEIVHRLLLLRFWVKTFRLRRRIIAKIDFWSNLVIDPLLALVGGFSILALWGVPVDVLTNMIYKLFTGFTVVGVNISLIAIALGILAFFVSITIVKSLRKRLESNVLAKMDIDDGIRHSLAAGFGFFGFIISALLAIAIMGGNLTNFALIAGALSFGIGLGLQNIVNNFVSGIILLFERPIKAGDWIIVNNQEGIVKQINIRSTELETWKKAVIIIPNSDLLSSIVTNLTHDDKWGRVDIKVGVAYGSDVDKVKEILLSIAADNKRLLKKPASYAIFADFGSSSLDFELRCFTADIMNSLTLSSEIRFEINRRFIEEGIEIPFPQHVLHIGDDKLKKAINSKLKAKG